jgi:hypothetical protein
MEKRKKKKKKGRGKQRERTRGREGRVHRGGSDRQMGLRRVRPASGANKDRIGQSK